MRSEEHSRNYSIKNIGNGVAIVEDYKYFIKGKEVSQEIYSKDIADFLDSYSQYSKSPRYTDIPAGSSIAVGESLTIIEIETVDRMTVELGDAITKRYAIKLKYKSLYNEKFEYVSRSLTHM
jgi:hypothetical protein